MIKWLFTELVRCEGRMPSLRRVARRDQVAVRRTVAIRGQDALAPVRGVGVIGRLFAGLLRVFAILPLRLGWFLADGLGAAAWALKTDAARVTAINLAKCFPELSSRERNALARRSLGHTWRLLIEAGPLTHWSAARLGKLLVEESDRSLVTEPLEQGRGLLMLVPHYGNWEYLCYVLGGLGFVALYDPPRVAGLEALLLRSRQRFGATLVPGTPQGLRTAYRTLKAGGFAAVLPDQVPAQGGVHAPFFGHPALTMTLAQRLAEKSGAPVLIGTARRVRNGFAAEYTPFPTDFDLSDPVAFATALNRAIEALVADDPAQYQWEYKRFKKPPPGSPDPYPKHRAR